MAGRSLAQHRAPDELSKLINRVEHLCELLEKDLAGRKSTASRPRQSNIRIRARSFIEATLRDGPKAWSYLVEEGAKFEHTEPTMRRARAGVAEQVRIEGVWMWRLKEGDGNG